MQPTSLLSLVVVILGMSIGSFRAHGLESEPTGEPKADRSASDVVRSKQSGLWSSRDTWESGRIPSDEDVVLIRSNDTVTYDVASSSVIRAVHISGTLTFATDKETRLEVGLIRIQPGDKILEEGFDCDHVPKQVVTANEGDSQPGFSALCVCCDNKAALLVGTPEQPIDTDHRALIRLHHVKGMDGQSFPAIVCCGGRMDFHGAPLKRTWVKLGATARSGDDQIVADESVADWKVGDRVLVTASFGNFGGLGSQTEERTIKGIEGAVITLEKPLRFRHTGEGDFRAEVANLSRNVIVESADPDGVRGHTMYHRGSAGSISYAEFRHLGKRGMLGRYPLHFHLCRDTMRGSSVIGASIWNSDNRWLTVHGTEYLIVRDCVGYNSVGHGFFLEDGTEVYNVLDRNLAVRADHGEPIPKQALPFDKNEGAGYWWANSLNTFTRNVAVDCAGYGFRYEATPRAGFRDKQLDVSFGAPERRFDLRLPVLQPDGRRKLTDIRTLPFVRFEGNTAHNIANYGLNLGQDSGGVGPDEDHPFVIREMTIWNAQRGYTVHVPHVQIDGLRIHRCGYEVYRARYRGQDYRNVRLTAIRGQYEVADLESYLASGGAVGEPGVGLNRARLPGFPRGTGAGGTSYQGALIETAALSPIDDMPPITVITHIYKKGDTLIVRGTATDNGRVRSVTVNGMPAQVDFENEQIWRAEIPTRAETSMRLVARSTDETGNVEQTPHEITVLTE